MSDRARQVTIGLALFQLVDALGNAMAPRRLIDEHLDHLGLPRPVRPALQLIKLSTSAGLLLGLRWPKLGATAAAGLVAFYSAAVTFHRLSGDHALVAAPAALCGASAAYLFVSLG